MRIRKLEIRNFRGIQNLQWEIRDNFVCLVGSGDSGKSTILQALEFLFLRDANSVVSDSVFWQCRTENAPVYVRAVISELPTSIIASDVLGSCRCGIDAEGILHNEPFDEHDACLHVQVEVDSESNVRWSVLDAEAKYRSDLKRSQRASMGFRLFAHSFDSHSRFVRGSGLVDFLNDWLDADRAVVAGMRSAEITEEVSNAFGFGGIGERLSSVIRNLGSYHGSSLSIGFVPDHGLRGGALGLMNEDGIPLALAGSGSRMLAAIAVQEAAFPDSAITAIDEVERGLEPHRLSRLLEHLEDRVATGGQVILTTHSPRVIEHFGPRIKFVRMEKGNVTVLDVPEEIGRIREGTHATVRTNSEAMLARRVVVAEGATELGFLRTLTRFWNAHLLPGEHPSTNQGIEMISAGGDSKVKLKVKAFRDLGFDTSAVLDRDSRNASATISYLVAEKVPFVAADEGKSLEQMVLESLDLDQILALVMRTKDQLGHIDAEQKLVEALGIDTWDYVELVKLPIENLRLALLTQCYRKDINGKSEGWYKNETGGELLGLSATEWFECNPDDTTDSLGGYLSRIRSLVFDARGGAG